MNIRFGLCTFLALLAVSCSSATTYGIPPKHTGDGEYVFTVYYNADADNPAIDRNIAEVLDKLKAKHGYTACDYERSPMVSPSRVKEIKVNVACR